MAFLQQYMTYILGGTAIVAVLSMVIGLCSLASAGALKRRFRKWKSIHATADLEEVYQKTLEEVDRLRNEIREMQNRIDVLQGQVRKKISTARVKRYNAFADMGSDLSFSVALLDDDMDGVVLSSIYGRDESRTYAKPIRSGTSDYVLTEEEIAVVQSGESERTQRSPVHA
jgi:TolA-binding protein